MEKILGKGKYGTVYKAKHRNGNTVAIKIVKKHNEGKPDYETVIVGLGLKHKNIVELTEHFTITDSGSPRGPYIVMEYCNGGDLNNYMIMNEPDLGQRVRFILDMALGVFYLHRKDIVHRDIKPENVLMAFTRGRCICKITDFGLSRVKEEEGQMFSTYCGTPAFMAPEIQDGEKYSNPVDVFSLGLLFFSVYKVTLVKTDGKLKLLPATEISETDYRLLNGVLCNCKKRPNEEYFVKLYFAASVEMGRLVYRMVEEEPEDRPSMEEVVKKIEDLVDEERDNRELPEETESVISEENTEQNRPDEAKSAKPEEAIHSAAVKTEDLVDEERDNRELPEETESVISEENTEQNRPDEANSAKPEEAIHSAAVKTEDLVDEERDNRELPEETESVISEENTEQNRPDEAKSAKPEEAIHSAAVKTETLNTETDMSDEPLDEESDYHSQNASDENALLIEPSQKQVISCFKAITCTDVQNVMLCFTYIVYTSVNLCCFFFQGLKQKGNKGLNNETFRFKIIILYPS